MELYGELVHVYVKYNDKIYNVIAGFVLNENGDDIEKAPVKSIELMYEKNGREGQTVLYSYDGTEENKKDWFILYDDGEYIEIMSPDIMGSLTLGINDTTVAGNSNREKAINSYNNAINTINSYCENLITNPNKISVRSLGSNQKNSSSKNNTKYISESDMFKNYFIQYTIESGDNNYDSDYPRLLFFDQVPEQICWLASRMQPRIEYDGRVCIRTLAKNLYFDGEDEGAVLGCVGGTDTVMDGTTKTHGVCPVVKLKADYGI